jgi:hypothetical protein
LETRDRAALLRISEEMNDAKNKDNFEDSIDVLASLLHDVWTLRVSGDEGRIVNSDLTGRLSDLSRHSASSNIPSWLADIDTMRENFAVNINRKIAADSLFVAMASN